MQIGRSLSREISGNSFNHVKCTTTTSSAQNGALPQLDQAEQGIDPENSPSKSRSSLLQLWDHILQKGRLET